MPQRMMKIDGVRMTCKLTLFGGIFSVRLEYIRNFHIKYMFFSLEIFIQIQKCTNTMLFGGRG